MAKKQYDVAARFQEVAKRASEFGKVNNKPKAEKSSFTGKTYDTTAFSSRPGSLMKKTGDVNLPIDTRPSSMKKKK